MTRRALPLALLVLAVGVGAASAATAPDRPQTKRYVVAASDLPGWRQVSSQAVVSGELIYQVIDRSYPVPTAKRVLDGWEESLTQSGSALTSIAAITNGRTAARLVLTHQRATLLAAGAVTPHTVTIGDGGLSGTAVANDGVRTGVTWTSGRTILGLYAYTPGAATPVLTEARLTTLARKIQARVTAHP